ncbi:MAG: helix-turn-helix transcriptional regulator [Planctomycetes bacterium]|nr:helix-turn-helix transcriptional regulator [Planctomycetota bacterium]
MSDTTLVDTHITICDWQGRVIWVSGDDMLIKPGDFAWEHLAEESHEPAKTAVARVVALREKMVVESSNELGQRFRAWLWPLHSPEMALCVLSVAIPNELSLLTVRENETLSHLAQGLQTREISTKMDVSTSTTHTHLRRIREKLKLTTLESLTAFAARYCHPHAMPTQGPADIG